MLVTVKDNVRDALQIVDAIRWNLPMIICDVRVHQILSLDEFQKPEIQLRWR